MKTTTKINITLAILSISALIILSQINGSNYYKPPAYQTYLQSINNHSYASGLCKRYAAMVLHGKVQPKIEPKLKQCVDNLVNKYN